MRLRTRLSIAAGAVVVVASVSVGYFGVDSTERAQVGAIDSVLDAGARQVRLAHGSEVSAALQFAEKSPIPLTMALRDVNNETTVVHSGSAAVNARLAMATVRAAARTAVTVDAAGASGAPNGHIRVRLRAVELSGPEYILLATSLAEVDSTRARGLRFLAFALAVSLVLSALLVYVLVRRDLRLMERLVAAAGRLARGDTSVEIPQATAVGEVDDLARALRQMVQSLADAVDVERQSRERMQRFLGDASHELRTPLTVIKGYAELLNSRQGSQDETVGRYLARINSEVSRMEALVSDLLVVTETGSQPLAAAEPVDLSASAESFAADLRALNPGRPVTTNIAPGVSVTGSPSLLAQMFSNIFGNITAHTPADAAVRVTLTGADDATATLVVDDAGPGLSAQACAAGIQAFQRFDPSRSRETGGFGLGMSIIAAIVAHHGGQTALQPSDLGGLRMVITVPAAQAGGRLPG